MIRERNNVNLRPMNTFGINAVCSRLIEFETPDELSAIFRDNDLANNRWNVLAGGSNIIFTEDYDGVLLHPAGRGITVTSGDGGHVGVRAEAGVVWDDFVEWCAGNGLWGVENLSGIPGLTGAVPVQNIGAYGAEARDIIESVEFFCTDNSAMLTLAAEDCSFGYRDSVFKKELKGRAVITAVNFRLSRTPVPRLDYGDLRGRVEEVGAPTLRNIRNAVIAIRDSKLPDPAVTGNAGSFFKNPVVGQAKADELKLAHPSMPAYPAGEAGRVKLAAGWLIDQCGWKGCRMGNAGVHERQALVLINLGGATGGEVMALAARIRSDVRDRFGIDIETEVNVI